MVEIISDRPLFKTILVEMVYFIIHLHNQVNKSRIAVLLLSKMQRKWEKIAACSFWTLRLTVPNSPITYNLSNFITGCLSLGDKIIEVLLYHTIIWRSKGVWSCAIILEKKSSLTSLMGGWRISITIWWCGYVEWQPKFFGRNLLM
jgi:hypothetical protein